MEANNNVKKMCALDFLNDISFFFNDLFLNAYTFSREQKKDINLLLCKLCQEKVEKIRTSNYFKLFQKLSENDSFYDLSLFNTNIINIENIETFYSALKDLQQILIYLYKEDWVNYQYEKVARELKEKNPFVYDNLESLINTIQFFDQTHLAENDLNSYKKTINKETIIEYIKEYLIKIDKKGNILKDFIRMLEKNEIFLWYPDLVLKSDDIPKEVRDNIPRDSWFCCTAGTKIDGKSIINLPMSHEIKDVIFLLHEFMHTQYKMKDALNVTSISEEIFPIIFEQSVNNFLATKEISQNELKKLKAIRRNNIHLTFNEWLPILKNIVRVKQRKKPMLFDIEKEIQITYDSVLNLFSYALGELISNYIQEQDYRRQQEIVQNCLYLIPVYPYYHQDINYLLYQMGLTELNYILNSKNPETKIITLEDKKRQIK